MPSDTKAGRKKKGIKRGKGGRLVKIKGRKRKGSSHMKGATFE